MTYHLTKGEFTISTDPESLDFGVIHDFLARSYWARDLTRETLRRSIEHSIPFGLFAAERQVGFARVITDRATFAYLADVFVLEEFRGRGLGSWLMGAVLAHPELQGLRSWLLSTRDAHTLYRKHGFVPLPTPERWMRRFPQSEAAPRAAPQRRRPSAGPPVDPASDAMLDATLERGWDTDTAVGARP